MRTKLLTSNTYSPTNPASEAAIRQQIDDSIQEVYDASYTEPEISALLLANQTGNHLGTWQGYSPVASDPGIQAIVTENESKLKILIVNPLSFGALGNDSFVNDTAINNAVLFAISNATSNNEGVEIVFPAGIFRISTYLSSLRQEVVSGMKDLKNITIRGQGKNTIFKGVSDTGFDVFQLNGVKNLTLKDFAITSVKNLPLDTTNGCNGISITNGTNNIFIENVFVYDLPYVVKIGSVDGSKAFTIQDGALSPQGANNIKILNCESENCAYGFEMDFDGSSVNIPNNILVFGNLFKAFYKGIEVSASQPVSGNFIAKLNVNILNNTVIGAQKSLSLSRASCTIAKNNRFFSEITAIPTIVIFDTVVEPIVVVGSENIIVSDNTIYYARADNYMRIGGLLTGATKFSAIENNYFAGQSVGKGIVAQDISGAICQNVTFINNQFKTVTGVELDLLLFNKTYQNVILSKDYSKFDKIGVGTTGNLVGADLMVNGEFGFAYTDGKTAYNTIKALGTGIAVKQTVTSTGTSEVFIVLNNLDSQVFSVTNSGILKLSGIESSIVGTIQSKRIPIRNIDGSVAGYIPLYNA